MATHYVAAPVTQARVQAAIDGATSGDTVECAADTQTWTGGVTVPDSKDLTITGAGIGNTVIAHGASTAFTLGESGSHLGGFGFSFSGSEPVSARGQDFRIHHCRFTNTSGSSKIGVYVYGGGAVPHPSGVIDNCEFFTCRAMVIGTVASWVDNNSQHRLWHETWGLGEASHMVVVEDCYFKTVVFGNCMDSNYGGRYTFRYNTVEDYYLETHSVQGNNRASRHWEVYENEFRVVDKLGSGGVWPTQSAPDWSSATM